MAKEELKNKAKREIEQPVSSIFFWASMINISLVVSFPFVWIWHELEAALKISITGVLLIVLLSYIYKFSKRMIHDAVEKEFEENPPKDYEVNSTTFKDKLNKMMKENSIKN